MNILHTIKSGRSVAIGGLLAFGLVALPTVATTSFAAKTTGGGGSTHVGPCRSDPVIFLSNGNMIDLTATINDSQPNIQQVVYTVHIPTGTSVTRIQYTQGFLSKESVVASADNPAGTYDTYTDASTTDSPVNVSTTGVVVYKNGTKSQMASTSGLDGQQLHLHISS